MRNEIILHPRHGIERTGISMADRMAQGYALRYASVRTSNDNNVVAEISWLMKVLEDGAVQVICRLSLASPIFGPCEERTDMTVGAAACAVGTDAEIEALRSSAGRCGIFFSTRLGMDGFLMALAAQLGVRPESLIVSEG